IVLSSKVSGAGLAGLSQLEELSVVGVGEEFCNSLGGMSRLRVLKVRDARFGDAGWKKLATTPSLARNLEHLVIEGGSVGPQGMAAIRGLAGLKRLEVYCDPVNDEVLRSIGAMSQLEGVAVGGF